MSDTTNLSVVSPTYEDGLLYIDIPFEWIDEDDLHVAELGEADALPRPATNQDATTWRFINRQKIQIVNPVVDKAYRVERRTSTDNVYAEFVPGTPIRSQDLNSNFKQTLHVVQENTGDRWSRTGDTMQGNIAMATYDANGNIVPGQGPFRVTGLDDPINDRDAVNKQSLAAYATTFTDLGTTAQETLEKYLGPVTTLPEYKVNEVNAGDVPELGTLAFYQNKMWMLVATGNTAYHAVWNEVVVAQVNPLNTFRTTIYPQGSSEDIRLNNLDTATDTTMDVVTYTLNSDHFANQSLSISTANFNILQINGKTLKPFTNSQGDYRASPATQGNEIYIAKDILDNEPFGIDKNLEVTLISFSSVDVAPSGWSSAEWTYNDQTSKWELTLIGDSSDLDITVDNLMPSFSAGTVTEVVINSDNSVGTPTFNVRKKDPNDPNSNEYEIDAGIPTGKSGGTINEIEFDNSGVPTYKFTNGSSLVGNVSLKGNKGDTGDYIGSSTFAYKAAPGSPGGFNHNLGAIDGMDGAGTLPSNYLEIIENWNVSNSSNQVGFADVYQLVGRYRLFSVGTAEETGQFFDVTNPEYLIGPAPYLSMGSVTTAAAGQGGSATFTDDLLTGDGYKLNLVLEAPRISVDGHTVTSFAEGTEGETESATFQYDGSSRLHTMQLNIEKAGPPTFATGSVNVTDNVNSDASVTFNDAGGDLSSDYVINVDLPLPLIEVGSGTETYNENTYVDGIRVVGSLSDPSEGQFAVYLDQQSKSDVDSNITGDDADDPTSKFKMYMDVPVFPAPQIEINTTVEEGDAPSVERGYLDDGTWTAGVNSADSTEYNLKFTLPVKVKSGNGHPNGQTALKDKWNVQVVAGFSQPNSNYTNGLRIRINGISSGYSELTAAHRADIIGGNWTTWLNDTKDWLNSTEIKTTIFGDIYSNVTVNNTTKTFSFTSTANEPFNSFTANMYIYSNQSVNTPERTQYGSGALAAVSGVQDQIYYDFHNNKVYQHDGTEWVNPTGFGESIESMHWGADGQLHITHQDPAKSVSTGDLRGPGYLSGSYSSSDGTVTFAANGFQGTQDVTTDDLRAPGFTGGSYNTNDGKVTFTSNGVNGGTDVVTEDLRVPFENKGALSEAPANPITGWFYRNTTDDNMYYYSGTEWVDMGTLRGPQGTSISSASITDGKLTIQLTDPFTGTTTTPINESTVRGASIIAQPGRINAGVTGYIPENPDTWNVGDKVLYTGDVWQGFDYGQGATKVALKGDVWLKGESEWTLVGNIEGPMGTTDSYGAQIDIGNIGTGVSGLDDVLPYRINVQVSGQTYTINYTETLSDEIAVWTGDNTVISSTVDLAGNDYRIEWTCPTSGPLYLGLKNGQNLTQVRELTVYTSPHQVVSDFDSNRFISGGDVIVQPMADNGFVTISNKNTIQISNQSGAGNYVISVTESGKLTTIDYDGEVVLPVLTEADKGATFVLFNKTSTAVKVRPQDGANVGIHLAGDNGHDGGHVWLSPKGLAHITYLHSLGVWGTWDINARHWICTGQGVTAISG